METKTHATTSAETDSNTKPKGGSPSHARSPTIIGLTYPVSYFIERVSLAQRLEDILKEQQRVVLVGLSGMGKSELAKSYAVKAHKNKSYDLIVWLMADSPEQLLVSSQQAVQKLRGSSEVPREDGEALLRVLKERLEDLGSQQRWLLIIDNAPGPEALTWLPQWGGDIIITSWRTDWSEITPLDVNRLVSEESYALLAKRLVITAEQVAADKAAKELVEHHLDGYPLVIAQVGATIKKAYGTNIVGFVETLSSQLDKKLDTFTTTLALPITALQKQANDDMSLPDQKAVAKSALELIYTCAYLAPTGLTYDLLKGLLSSPATYGETMSLLTSYALLSFEINDSSSGGSPNTATVHRLIQQRLRESLPIEDQCRYSSHALTFFNKEFIWRRVDYNQTLGDKKAKIGNDFAPHAVVLVEHGLALLQDTRLQNSESVTEIRINLATLLNSLGRFYIQRNFIEVSFNYYQQAKSVLTPVMQFHNYIADLSSKDETKKARAKDMVRLYGTEILHNTGSLGLRIWEESDAPTRQAIVADLKQAYDLQAALPDKTDTEAHSLSYTQRSLARAYKKQALMLTDLTEQRKGLIEAQNNFLTLANTPAYISKPETRGLAEMDLGVIAKLLEDTKPEAERNYLQAIKHLETSRDLLSKTAFANKDKDLAVTLVRLAEAYAASKDYRKADTCLRQAIAADQRYYGEQISPTTARAYYRLATVNAALDRSGIALESVQQALNLQTTLYGPTHPYVVASQTLQVQLKPLLQNASLTSSIPPMTQTRDSLIVELLTIEAERKLKVGDLTLIKRCADIQRQLGSKEDLEAALGIYKVYLEKSAKDGKDNFIDQTGYEDALYQQGQTHIALGDSKSAIANYQHALELNPDHSAAKVALEYALRKQAQPLTSTDVSLFSADQKINRFQKWFEHYFAVSFEHYERIASGKAKFSDKTQTAMQFVKACSGFIPKFSGTIGVVSAELDAGKAFGDMADVLKEKHTQDREDKANKATERLASLEAGELKAAIGQLAQDFEKQINALDDQGIHDLAKCAVERTFKYNTSDKANPKLPLGEKIRVGVLKGKIKDQPLTTQAPGTDKNWTVAGVLEHSGIELDTRRQYVRRGKEDEHKKYGFHKGTTQDTWAYGYSYEELTSVRNTNSNNIPDSHESTKCSMM